MLVSNLDCYVGLWILLYAQSALCKIENCREYKVVPHIFNNLEPLSFNGVIEQLLITIIWYHLKDELLLNKICVFFSKN